MTNENRFSDIKTHWARKCIAQLGDRNLVSGYPDGSFRPNATLNRAEFAVLMCNAFPNAPVVRDPIAFVDVPGDHWAAKAIQTASSKGFFIGYPNGTFRPNYPILRVQALIVLAAQLRLSIPKNPTQVLQDYFEDAAQIPNYAKNLTAAATLAHLTVNYPYTERLRPNNKATRGDVAAFLCQALNIFDTIPPRYIRDLNPAVIAPQFEAVEAFSGGVAWVQTGGKWGAIDPTGKRLIEPEYYTHYPFQDGLALVTIGGKYRYLDPSGNIAIQADFEEAYSFSQGLALVKINGLYGFINVRGEMEIQTQFELARSFSEGLAAVKVQGKTGFIDKTGKFAIAPKFNWADPFSDGIAWGAIEDKSVLIDKTGSFVEVVNLEMSDSPGHFSEGLARVTLNQDGFIDRGGNLAIPHRFSRAESFLEGVSAVRLSSEKAGFIDPTGTVAIPTIFSETYSFSQGLARVKYDDKYGYISQTGHFIITPQFDRALDFAEGLAPVKIGDLWGYIRHPLL